MSARLIKLQPNDRVCDALRIMHEQHVRNLPVVDENGQFVGLFGMRRLTRLLLPKAAQIDIGIKDLNFMPDDMDELGERMQEVSQRPVSEFLEKKKKLMFCSPSTGLPEVLELLDQSSDTSLPVIVVKGKKNKLVGMVSAWDVIEKVLLGLCEIQERKESDPPATAPQEET
jgi:CBS domain-containing protein